MVEGGREVTEVSGDVSTRLQCLVFRRTNLLRNVCSTHSSAVVLSIIITNTITCLRKWTLSYVFSLEDLVRKPFMDELLITDLKRSGKYLSLAFLWVWRMDRLVARFSAISCQMATSIFTVWFSPSYNSPNGISHETHDTRFDAAFITRQQREGEIILSCGNTLLSCFISKCLYPTIFLHPHDACRLCRLKKIAEQRLIEHTSVFCPSCYVLFSALTWRENIFWIPNKTQQQD